MRRTRPKRSAVKRAEEVGQPLREREAVVVGARVRQILRAARARTRSQAAGLVRHDLDQLEASHRLRPGPSARRRSRPRMTRTAGPSSVISSPGRTGRRAAACPLPPDREAALLIAERDPVERHGMRPRPIRRQGGRQQPRAPAAAPRWSEPATEAAGLTGAKRGTAQRATARVPETIGGASPWLTASATS